MNGIGEGKEADIGIAGGQGSGILFKKGKLVHKVPSEDLIETLIEEVELMAKEKEAESVVVTSSFKNSTYDEIPFNPSNLLRFSLRT